MYESTYSGLHKWTHKTVEKFAWAMMFGDENDKLHYERSIRKLNKALIKAHSVYSEKDRLHDIEVLINTVKSLYGLINKCSSPPSSPSLSFNKQSEEESSTSSY
jgi:hypothetical protein